MVFPRSNLTPNVTRQKKENGKKKLFTLFEKNWPKKKEEVALSPPDERVIYIRGLCRVVIDMYWPFAQTISKHLKVASTHPIC